MKKQKFGFSNLGLSILLVMLVSAAQMVWASRSHIGTFESITGKHGSVCVSGYAYDPDTLGGTTGLNISVWKGNSTSGEPIYEGWGIASEYHKTMATNLGERYANHGFNECLPVDEAGYYTVKVIAQDVHGYDNDKDLGSKTVSAYAPYVVGYDANGGSGAPGTQLKHEDIGISVSEDIPTRNKYEFDGWTLGSSVYLPGDGYYTEGNATFVARWIDVSSMIIASLGKTSVVTVSSENIADGITSVKIYDDGGRFGGVNNYAPTEELVVNVPVGYGLKLTGSVDMSDYNEYKLIINDGVQDHVYTSSGSITTPIKSQGQSMTIRYKPISNYNSGDGFVFVLDIFDSRVSITTVTIPSIPKQTYTGASICPEVNLKNGTKDLVVGEDYTVKCSNNINVGTATMLISGIGNYMGSVSKSFEIVAPPSSSSQKQSSSSEGAPSSSSVVPPSSSSEKIETSSSETSSSSIGQVVETSTSETSSSSVGQVVETSTSETSSSSVGKVVETSSSRTSSSSVEENIEEDDESSSSQGRRRSSSSAEEETSSSSTEEESSSSEESKQGLSPVMANSLDMLFIRNELMVTNATGSELKVFVFDVQGNLKKQYRSRLTVNHHISLKDLNQGTYVVRLVSGSHVQMLRVHVK